MTALRWTLVGLAVLALAAYAGIVLLLFTHQREMLFVRGRTAHEGTRSPMAASSGVDRARVYRRFSAFVHPIVAHHACDPQTIVS